ncbi:MAG: DUF1549 domain-containing protein [Pirellulales bacterium]
MLVQRACFARCLFRCLLGLAAALPLSAACLAADIRITPDAVVLEGNFARAQLLVTALGDDGTANELSADLTRQAAYVSDNPAVATVDAAGRLLAIADGQATIAVTAAGVAKNVVVTVTGVVPQPQIKFNDQIAPILSKAGCNMGACHAAQHGKGGFKLSVFNFAPEQDWEQIIRDRGGRRVDMLNPERSLFLRKPTLDLPHGGSLRLQKDSVDYQTLAAWIAGGATRPDPKTPAVASIEVLPNRRQGKMGLTQQLQVVATYADGRKRDVTHWCKFDSMDDAVLNISADGHLTAIGRGQAPAMARFEGQAAVCTVVVPFAENIDLAGWVDNNFVDTHAAAKFRELGIAPSPLCDDATFIRRAYLDAIGTLPTMEESQAFLQSADPDKRKKAIDRLLGLTGDPAQDIYVNQYAAFWAIKWSDLIRASSAKLGEQGMWSMHNWIKSSLRSNKPFDQFVRELITAKGSIYTSGPANYYRIFAGSDELTEATAQLFLGVRMQCAKCHHHPFEKYSQSDYYGMAAFFARVGTKGTTEFGLFGGDTVVLVRSGGEVGHPRTGQIMKPTPLEGEPIEDPLDRRRPLAEWLTSRDNAFFSRNVANRYMGYLMGRGLCDPIDDMRATNPPTNIPLMDALADDFVQSGFNLRHLMRTIMNSRLYQLEYRPTEANAGDTKFYSHYHVKRLSAEVLLDAIDYATGVQTKYPSLPQGTRAIDLPDSNYNDYSLKVLGKPLRVSTCECERVSDPSLVQTLHLLNSPLVSDKIANPAGRVARLLNEKKSHDEIVNELFMATLCRLPGDGERGQSVLPAGADAKQHYEDLLWALINSKHFVFNH